MPKGQKIIDWTPENESKLLHTIMAVHDVKVDYDKVAAAFGKFCLNPTPSPVPLSLSKLQQLNHTQNIQ